MGFEIKDLVGKVQGMVGSDIDSKVDAIVVALSAKMDVSDDMKAKIKDICEKVDFDELLKAASTVSSVEELIAKFK